MKEQTNHTNTLWRQNTVIKRRTANGKKGPLAVFRKYGVSLTMTRSIGDRYYIIYIYIYIYIYMIFFLHIFYFIFHMYTYIDVLYLLYLIVNYICNIDMDQDHV